MQAFLTKLLTVDLPGLMVLPKRLEVNIPPSLTSVAEAAVGRDAVMRAVASAVLQVSAPLPLAGGVSLSGPLEKLCSLHYNLCSLVCVLVACLGMVRKTVYTFPEPVHAWLHGFPGPLRRHSFCLDIKFASGTTPRSRPYASHMSVCNRRTQWSMHSSRRCRSALKALPEASPCQTPSS